MDDLPHSYPNLIRREIDRIKTHLEDEILVGKVGSHRDIKAQEEAEDATSATNEPKNPFPQIFREGQYHLFDYLFSELSQQHKAKASTLYHYFKYHNKFSAGCTQEKYIEFIELKYQIKLSKIFPRNHIAEDLIKETLPRMEDRFNRNEMN